MSDYTFLPFFITEPVYVVKEPSALPTNIGHASDEKYEAAESAPLISEINIKSKGGFKKNILLLVDDPYPEILNSTDLEFLLKILKAVHLTEDDVAIVNIRSFPLNFFPIIKERFNYRVLIMFGIDPGSLSLGIEKYKIRQENDTKILAVDSLTDIDKDKQKKLKLWENLQLLFIMK